MIRSLFKSAQNVPQILNSSNQNFQCQPKLIFNQCNQSKGAKLYFKINFNFFKQQKTIDYKKKYYQILKIKQTANLIQIKQNFYKLAKQSHPDTSKGNQEIFKLINQAYNVLSHQERRRLYDKNRERKQEYPNDKKGEQFSSSSSRKYQQSDSQSEYQNYKNSQDYQERKQQAYYHHSRGQWQQFRSGYKYHINPQQQYYSNLKNNISSQKYFQNMKRVNTNKTQSEQQFLDQMEKYFQYEQKINEKRAKDLENYYKKMDQLEKQLYESKKAAFRKTIIGKGFTKVQDFFERISNKMEKYFVKQKNHQQNQQK